MAKIFLTSGTSWAGVATDGSDLIIECIGGGGGGQTAPSSQIGLGAGGGAYATKTVPYVSGASVSYVIGAGGPTDTDGTDTTWDGGVVIAKAGKTPVTSTPGVGGPAASCTPSTGAHSGGAGGPLGANLYAASGGGGAAGPNGDGKAGGQGPSNGSHFNGSGGGGAGGGSSTAGVNPGDGDPSGAGGVAQDGTAGGAGVNHGTPGPNGNPGSHGSGGSGGGGGLGTSSGNGGAGGDGVEFDATHGAGGGGGAGAGSNQTISGGVGGDGGRYGGGGGGGGWANGTKGAGGAGGPGLIVITYTSAAGDVTLSPATGSIALTGATPTLTTTLYPITGSIALTGAVPTLSQATVLSPATGTIALTGGTPTLSRVLRLSPVTGQIRISTNVKPSISIVRQFGIGEDLWVGGSKVNWRESTFRIDRSVTKLDTAEFGYVYTGGPRFQKYDEVAKFVNGVKRFGGFLDNYDEESVGGTDDESFMVFHCKGYSAALDWVVINKLYKQDVWGGLISVILLNIWEEKLQPLGVTYNVEGDGDPGVVLPDMLFKAITGTEACNMMLKYAPGWSIWIDENKRLRLKQVVDVVTADAPFAISDGSDNWDYLSLTKAPAPQITTQYVLPAKDIYGVFVDTHTGDGINFVFTTTYGMPTGGPNVYVDDVRQVVTIEGTWPAGWQCYYVKDGVGIFFDVTNPPAIGAVIRIEYTSPFPLAVSVTDPTPVTNSFGPREATYHAKDVTTLEGALALAQGLLDMKKVDSESGILRYSEYTESEWLTPGQSISIEKTIPLATGNYGIEQVRSSEQEDTTWRHDVTIRKGPASATGSDQIDELLTSSRSDFKDAIPTRITIELGKDNPPDTNPGLIVGATNEWFRVPTVEGGLTFSGWDWRAPTDPPIGAACIIDILIEDTPGSGTYTSIYLAGDANKPTIPDGIVTEVTGFEFADATRRYVGGERGYVNIIQVGSTDPGKHMVFHLKIQA